MSTARVAIGFAVTVLLGAGFGAGLVPYAASEMAPRSVGQRPPRSDPRAVTVEEVSGPVSVRTGSQGWRRVAEGQVLTRPLTIRTNGLDAYVRVFVKGTRLIVSQTSMVHLGAAGRGFTFQVDGGLVLAYRDKQLARALVPLQEVSVKGQAFGLWVQPKRTIVSILEGDATIRYQDQRPQTFSFNREVVLRRGVLTPAVLPTQLTVNVITQRKLGKQSRIAARTWPNSRVYAFGTEGFQSIELSRGGTFAIQVPGDLPAPGTLIAMDAAGRWAELEQPSRRLEQVLHDLKTGRARRAHAPRVDDAAARAEAAPPPPPRPREPKPDRPPPPPPPKPAAPPPDEPPPIDDAEDDIDESAL